MSLHHPETYDDCRVAAHFAGRQGRWADAHKLALQAAALAPTADERQRLTARAKDYKHAAKVAINFNVEVTP